MNQQPDKLFREKLEGLSRPAPVNAWDKIEAGLDKKNNKALWLKIAASLLVISITGYILWPTLNQTPEKTIAVKSANEKKVIEKKPQEEVSAKTSTDKIESEPSTQEEKSETLVEVKGKKVVKKRMNNLPATPAIEKEKNETIVPIKEEVVPNLNETVASVDETTTETIQPTEESTHTVASNTNITLVFTAKESNEYLNKNSLAEATSEEKKPSTLKKLWKKASDLKTNQDPFGELRQKKNEILALNFKNDKQRGQNK
jgi:hypothetical protein